MTAPIEPQDYLHGAKVVDIGDLRIARGMTRRPQSACRHRNLVYDKHERRVWCQDCEQEVEPFDAFAGLVENFDAAIRKLSRREQAVKDAEQAAVRSRAAQALDKVWRSHTMAPLCPHCREALLPEDVATGVASMSRDLVRAKRQRTKEGKQ